VIDSTVYVENQSPLEKTVKELTILAALCGVLGVGCFAAAAFALLGGEDVGIERIFGVIVWSVIGISLLGAAQWIARMGPLRKKPKTEDDDSKHAGSGPAAGAPTAA
jgi:hypothetical protein